MTLTQKGKNMVGMVQKALCEHCGKLFATDDWHLARGLSRFCSPCCAGAYGPPARTGSPRALGPRPSQ